MNSMVIVHSYVNVYQRVSMEIWGCFNGTNIYIWNYVF